MGFLAKHKFPIAVATFCAVAFSIAVYTYTCTCWLGDAICEAQGKKHDAVHPYFSELNYTFLKEPGWVLYPWAAMMRGEEGTVGLKLSISREGVVQDREIVISSGSALLDQAALEAIETFAIDPDRLRSSDPIVHEWIKISFQMEN